MNTGPHQRSVVARHGHGDQAHHDGAGLRCSPKQSVVVLPLGVLDTQCGFCRGGGVSILRLGRQSVRWERDLPFFAILTRRWRMRTLGEVE